MKIAELTTDAAILEEIGKRLLQARIDRSLTQAELAEQAGVSKRTVERIEAGMSSQLSNLIRILRVLDLLPVLDSALPQARPRPMDLLKLGGKQRRRVVKRGTGKQEETWEWGDEE